MITSFKIENFKRIDDAKIALGGNVVFIGPNNSGKTTALQALALWDIGWKRWAEKREGSSAKKRQGVTINRRDLYAIPVPSSKLLWNDLHTHAIDRTSGKQETSKIYVTLTAEGIHRDKPWRCALEFYYANEESFYCRLKDGDGEIPIGVRAHNVVFLPPMSGLTEREFRKEPGEISLLIGEGQTAQVLRNLCWQLFAKEDKSGWNRLVKSISAMFQITLNEPVYLKERSELTLTYREQKDVELDLSSSGRGCQQVLLLLAFILANPGAVLLLDEPDAHLEILRQRDIYNLLTEIAAETGSQIIAASHSEVILQEAAERDVVVAFVGRPHRIDTRSRTQVKKALESIRMADYYLAEQNGWMLYLEGSTDLAILRRLAERLNHPATAVLGSRVPAQYLDNNIPQGARDHFYGLREAKSDLVGFLLLDRVQKVLKSDGDLVEKMWSRREIENYLVTPESLRAYVQLGLRETDLLEAVERRHRVKLLDECIAEIVAALKLVGKPDPWGADIKVTDDFLDPLFKLFNERLGTPERTFKRDYHGLAAVMPLDQLDHEITAVLDELLVVAQKAIPVS